MSTHQGKMAPSPHPTSPPGSRVTLLDPRGMMSSLLQRHSPCHAEDTGGAAQAPEDGPQARGPFARAQGDHGEVLSCSSEIVAYFLSSRPTVLFRAREGDEAGPRPADGRGEGWGEAKQLGLLFLRFSILTCHGSLGRREGQMGPLRRIRCLSLQEAFDCSGSLYPSRHAEVHCSQSPLSASETIRCPFPSSP